MRSKTTRVFTSFSTWVVVAAGALALLSIGVVTTLQQRADTARNAQVTLSQIERDVDALQSIPFDANGQGAAAKAAVRVHMQASEARIERQLARLRRDH